MATQLLKVRGIENLLTLLGLSQIISEPTNFEPNKSPSFIDLIITDQPNFVLDSGTRASLDPYCHHQIIYCKINFSIPPPPSERKICRYHRANLSLLKGACPYSFPWSRHLNINPDPNWQVKQFTEIFLNIMSNFVPHETKRVVPRDLPLKTKSLKSKLNRENSLKATKDMVTKPEDKIRVDNFRKECQEAVETAKLSYLTNIDNKLNDLSTS